MFKLEFIERREIIMAEWIMTLQGEPQFILDEHCFRDLRGVVNSWLFGNGVYALTGEHVGWFEAGTLFDLQNQIIGKIASALPELSTASAIEMPVFQRRPQVPTLRARRPRIARDDSGARSAVYSIETALSNEKLASHRMRPALYFERACM